MLGGVFFWRGGSIVLCTMAGTGYGACHSIGMTSSSHAGLGSGVQGQGSPGGTFSVATLFRFKQDSVTRQMWGITQRDVIARSCSGN